MQDNPASADQAGRVSWYDIIGSDAFLMQFRIWIHFVEVGAMAEVAFFRGSHGSLWTALPTQISNLALNHLTGSKTLSWSVDPWKSEAWRQVP